MISVNCFTTSVESKAHYSMSEMSSLMNPFVNPSKNFTKFSAFSLTNISERTNLEDACERNAVAMMRIIRVLFILILYFLILILIK